MVEGLCDMVDLLIILVLWQFLQYIMWEWDIMDQQLVCEVIILFRVSVIKNGEYLQRAQVKYRWGMRFFLDFGICF